MTYATQQDLIDRFGERELIELTDRAEPATGAIDVTVVGKALTDADHEINARVAPRYAVPLSPAPDIIVRRAADIARYFLHGNRATDQVGDAYAAAIAFLKDVAAGRAALGIPVAAAASGGSVQFNESGKVFSRDAFE